MTQVCSLFYVLQLAALRYFINVTDRPLTYSIFRGIIIQTSRKFKATRDARQLECHLNNIRITPSFLLVILF